MVPTFLSGSGNFEGLWKLTRNLSLEGSLKSGTNFYIKLASHHNRFIGIYVGLDNDSFFQGESYSARGKTLIHFIQSDHTYYAIHVGREITPTRFEGCWYDVAGNEGRFRLEVVEP